MRPLGELGGNFLVNALDNVIAFDPTGIAAVLVFDNVAVLEQVCKLILPVVDNAGRSGCFALSEGEPPCCQRP